MQMSCEDKPVGWKEMMLERNAVMDVQLQTQNRSWEACPVLLCVWQIAMEPVIASSRGSNHYMAFSRGTA